MTATAVALATTIGVVLGVAVHLALHEAGASNDRTTVQVQVEGARLGRADEPAEVHLDRLHTSVFRVGSSGCGETRQATATAVQGVNGPVLLTNAHVVRGSGTVSLRAFDGTTFDVDVAGSITGRDAAVLRLPTDPTDPTNPTARTGRDGAAEIVAAPSGLPSQIGDEVVVAGYPGGDAATRMGSVVSIEARSGFGGTSDVLVIDAHAQDGLSGSAVLDAEGRVVGLVVARDPSSGYVVAYPIGSVLAGTIAPIPTC